MCKSLVDRVVVNRKSLYGHSTVKNEDTTPKIGKVLTVEGVEESRSVRSDSPTHFCSPRTKRNGPGRSVDNFISPLY